MLAMAAIEKTSELPDGATVAVYRVAKRQFEIADDTDNPPKGELVFVAHATWATNGWYKKHHPEWVSC